MLCHRASFPLLFSFDLTLKVAWQNNDKANVVETKRKHIFAMLTHPFASIWSHVEFPLCGWAEPSASRLFSVTLAAKENRFSIICLSTPLNNIVYDINL